MSKEDKLYRVLDYILNQASSSELEVITGAVNRRTKDFFTGPGGIGPKGMAQSMAKRIQSQLGASFNVGEISRQIVSDIIRKQEPGITDRELDVLLDKWLPRRGKASPEKNVPLPPDVMITMISQFVSYKQGKMPAEEEKELPEDWINKYWKALPESARVLITSFLNGDLDEKKFWAEIVASLGQ